MSRLDERIDRRNTCSLKYDFAKEHGKPEDVLPLWVADMDFRAPDEVLDALRERVDHGIFGYSSPKADYHEAVIKWFDKHFHWKPEPEWLVMSPGVVFAINCAIRAFTEKGDGVMIQPPVYYPFESCIRDNKRRVVNNELTYNNGRYEMDFADFEQKIQDNSVSLFILCSPHNPVGRVWSREELRRIGEICIKYNVFVVADEIHCDFTYPGHEHSVFASISPEFAEKCIVCTSPGKTFNLAGLQVSNIFIADKEHRRQFEQAVTRTGYYELNTMGITAGKAAYEYGEEWLLEVKEYLWENVQTVKAFLQEHIPQIRVIEPEGTYLLWLDCKRLGLTEAQLEELMVEKARIWLDAGSMFGRASGQFERINLACPRSVIVEALERLERAVKR